MEVKTMFRNFLALLLAACLQAQQTPAGAGTAQAQGLQTTSLRVLTLIGGDAVNSIPLRTTTEPVVEVRDQNDRPIEGAEVVFELPQAGPGAGFPGDARTLTVRTNAQGQAAATGMRANSQAGKFRIKTTASYSGLSAVHYVNQVNSLEEITDAPPRKGSGKRWLWIAGLGGAAAAAIVLATGGSSSASSSSGVVSINPGAVSIGGPR